MARIDPDFLALPASALAAAALSRARELGVAHADFRLERNRMAALRLRDGQPDPRADDEGLGLAVRVVHDGTWGFASGIDRTPEAAARLAEQAVATAKLSRVLSTDPVELAAETVYPDASWVSAYEVNPFDVPAADRLARLAELSELLRG